MNTQYLIKNAYAILTGLSGDAARSSATDIRIQDGKISALGQLSPEPEDTIVEALLHKAFDGRVFLSC